MQIERVVDEGSWSVNIRVSVAGVTTHNSSAPHATAQALVFSIGAAAAVDLCRQPRIVDTIM